MYFRSKCIFFFKTSFQKFLLFKFFIGKASVKIFTILLLAYILLTINRHVCVIRKRENTHVKQYVFDVDWVNYCAVSIIQWHIIR